MKSSYSSNFSFHHFVPECVHNRMTTPLSIQANSTPNFVFKFISKHAHIIAKSRYCAATTENHGSVFFPVCQSVFIKQK